MKKRNTPLHEHLDGIIFDVCTFDILGYIIYFVVIVALFVFVFVSILGFSCFVCVLFFFMTTACDLQQYNILILILHCVFLESQHLKRYLFLD